MGNSKQVDEFLAHHGVLGMKWGVRNLETRARYAKLRTYKLSDEQKKKLKIGAAIAATALATVGMAYLYKTGKLDTLIAQGRDYLNPSPAVIDTTTGFAKITDDKIGLSKINRFNIFDKGTTMNCGNCTIATELRRRGLDVKAKSNPVGMTWQQMAQYFDLKKDSVKNLPFDETTIPKGKKLETFKNLLVNQYEDGARGSLMVPHKFGNHFVGFEIKNGSVNLTDAQTKLSDMNSLFENVDTVSNTLGKKLGGIQSMRLDNAEINTPKIREVVTSSKRGFVDSKAKINDIFNFNTIVGKGFEVDRLYW